MIRSISPFAAPWPSVPEPNPEVQCVVEHDRVPDVVPPRARRTTMLGRVVGAALACLVGVSFGVQPTSGAPLTDHTSACPADEIANRRIKKAARRPLGKTARELAAKALTPKNRASATHPFLLHKAELKRRLSLLGLLKDSHDHVHISDVDLEHGGAVLRSALGLNPLVKSVTSTLSVGDVPEAFAKRHLSPEQFERLWGLDEPDQDLGPVRSNPVPTMVEMISGAVTEIEGVILEKRLRVAMIREQRDSLTKAGRIFVNMSFGQSADRIADGIVRQIERAPAGSALAEDAQRALGTKLVRRPDDWVEEDDGPRSACDVDKPAQGEADLHDGSADDSLFEALDRQKNSLKRKFVYPALRAAFAEPAAAARLARARADLTVELLRAREAQILVFEAAGNSYDSARRAGDPTMSRGGSTGAHGFLRVGALDLRRFPDPSDDRVAKFTADGQISFATHGVRLPVWIEMGQVVDSEGTSFSSPVSVEVAVALASNALGISVDRVAELLLDRRAGHDILGTTRDGRGALDEFAAIVLAANPKLSREAIDEAWRSLGEVRPNVTEIKTKLGLS